MYQLSQKSETALRACLKLGECTKQDICAAITEFDAKESVNSLRKCGYIEVVRQIIRAIDIVGQRPLTRPVNVYLITERGRMAIHHSDFPNTRKMKALKVPLKPEPKPESKKQELHEMQNWIIPDRKPNVNEMTAEIGGREVKITYGVHVPYEVYVPPVDKSRNYTPRPQRGILA